jgi:hypothetical protein
MHDRRLLTRILGEYREMPGLMLTATQAARLWGIDVTQCLTALQALVTAGHLYQTPDGHFLLPSREGRAVGRRVRR